MGGFHLVPVQFQDCSQREQNGRLIVGEEYASPNAASSLTSRRGFSSAPNAR
jgi:hypothetical protein